MPGIQSLMKILHVIDSGGLYGAERVLLDLVAEHLKLRLQPEIASIGRKGISEKPIEREAKKMNLPLSVFRMRAGPNFAGALRIRDYAFRSGFQLFHTHGYKGNILLGFMPKSFRRLPLVTTLHGYINTGEMNRMRVYQWLDRMALARLDAVVLVSEMMRSNLKLSHPVKNGCRIILNGILPAEDSAQLPPEPVARDIEAFCENGFILGAVGRLSREKAFHCLIEAFGMIAQSVADMKLLILGEGRQRGILEAQIRNLGLEERILMPGFVEKAARYMKLFDVFVLSSITEGLPVSLLEAMQQGKAVVSTRAGGVVQVVKHGENGLLVKSDDPAALAGAIDAVYRDTQLKMSLGRRARQDFLEKYSSERMAREYQRLYREILD